MYSISYLSTCWQLFKKLISESAIYKPIAKGNADGAILTDMWTEHFAKDQIEKLGGAVREDILTTPLHLGDKVLQLILELLLALFDLYHHFSWCCIV
jgi:hypothetical protein